MDPGVALAAPRRSRWVWPIGALVAAALLLLVVPAAAALPLAVGHAQYHAIMALAVLAPAFLIAWRRRAPSLATTAALLGFGAFGIAQVVESVGGLGYGPDNDSRVNGLANVHDLGLGLSAIGLVTLLAGIVVSMASIVGRRTHRPLLASAGAAPPPLVGGVGGAQVGGV